MPLQFEVEFPEDGEICGQACEVRVGVAIWWRRGQPHGQPTFRVCRERSAKIGTVRNGQIGPIFDYGVARGL